MGNTSRPQGGSTLIHQVLDITTRSYNGYRTNWLHLQLQRRASCSLKCMISVEVGAINKLTNLLYTVKFVCLQHVGTHHVQMKSVPTLFIGKCSNSINLCHSKHVIVPIHQWYSAFGMHQGGIQFEYYLDWCHMPTLHHISVYCMYLWAINKITMNKCKSILVGKWWCGILIVLYIHCWP